MGWGQDQLQHAAADVHGFGLACGSLVTAYYLGEVPRTNQAALSSALHHALLTLAVLTLVSSLAFWKLWPDDGESVSKGQAAEAI